MGKLGEALRHRFGDFGHEVAAEHESNPTLTAMATRGVIRRFEPTPLEAAVLDMLAAVALSTPTKSDLQQRDILIVDDATIRARLDALLAGQDWIAGAPHMIVFLADNRRQRQLHAWRGRPFANDHLDAFFNASVDAAIALAGFVTAAEAIGLGCCPISAIRNHAAEVSEILALPDHVFPVAALGLGRPAVQAHISARLPLAATVHRDRFRDDGMRALVEGYDRRRNGIFPYRSQRDTARFGEQADYGWSEEKARHYASPERADFGAFIRAKGFKLD
jgi:nitroreductase